MSNGAEVRTLAELKDNFDISSIYMHYKTGRLFTWLKDRDCKEEAMKIETINAGDNIFEQLYAAFGIEPATSSSEPDMARLDRMIEIQDELKRLVVEREVFDHLDEVALTQEDLEACIRDGKKHVYLVKGEFDVRELPEEIIYDKIENAILKTNESETDDKENFTCNDEEKRRYD